MNPLPSAQKTVATKIPTNGGIMYGNTPNPAIPNTEKMCAMTIPRRYPILSANPAPKMSTNICTTKLKLTSKVSCSSETSKSRE